MRSPLYTVVAASAALRSLALFVGFVLQVRAEVPSAQLFRRLQIGPPYTYASPAPVFPTAAPIPPAPMVLRPVVAPLIQGAFWRMHNGLAAASNSLLGTGIPYAGPLDPGVQVTFAPASPFPSVDALQGVYHDQRNILYETNTNAAGTANFTPGREPLNYEEALRQAAGDLLYDPYKTRAFPMPAPHSPDYPFNEQSVQHAQQQLQSSNIGQQHNPAIY